MPILSLLFILAFLLLPRLVVLGLNRTSIKYGVVRFLNIGINLCVTKLLLFPTVTWSREGE